MLRKRYTKMRRVKRRRSTTRRPSTGFRKNTPEVKIWTGSYPALEIDSHVLAAATINLPNSAFLIADAINNIVAGTGSTQRIGNRIFVKKIQYSFTAFLCPEGNSVSLNAAVARFVITSAGWDKTAGTSIPRFFDTDVTRPLTGPLNRRLYKIYKDVYVHFNAGWPASTNTSGVADVGNGMVKHFNINVNVNKNVKFTPGATTVADESSSYSLIAMAYIPSQPSNTEVRALCSSLRLRIWYTDD